MAVFHSLCIVLLTTAATTIAQNVTIFRPSGYGDLRAFGVGRGPSPIATVLHLAHLGADTSPACNGTNDILTVTFPAPVAGPVRPEDIRLLICVLPDQTAVALRNTSSEERDCQFRFPSCVGFQPGDETNEHRAVLLYGSFANFSGQSLISSIEQVEVRSVREVLDGAMPSSEYGKHRGFSWRESNLLLMLPTLHYEHTDLDQHLECMDAA